MNIESDRPSESTETSTQAPKAESAEGFQELTERLGEVSTYLSLYLESQRDRLQLAVKQGLWGLALFPLAVVVVAGLILIALVFLSYGAAIGLGQALGHRPWLGFLVTGAGLWIFLGVVLLGAIKIKERHQIKTRKEKWSQEMARQQNRYGHDAEERAAQA